MRSRLIPVLIFIMLAVLAVPLVMRLGAAGRVDPVTLDTLDFGGGRIIRITVEPNSQQTLSLHYHAEVNGQTQIDHAFFGTLPRTSPPPRFIIHGDKELGLIGIAQQSVPHRIVILHDFATGQSYPHRIATYKDTDPDHLYPYYEQQPSIEARGEALFDQLKQLAADQGLDLLRTMGTRPLAVPPSDVNTPPSPPG